MTSVLSGIDQALWDITGKVCGQPVYRLLGGAYHDRVRLYARNDRGLGSMAAEAWRRTRKASRHSRPVLRAAMPR
jgi:L-alanine-DL-glutamate epimerase-like enolase superfamily enzyme